MKKIFAIALALVMVLSMASAFALSDCDTRTYSWDCLAKTTYCGKAKVEVVPYVHVNADCESDDFVVSTCAGAVADEFIYYAIKLTVDAYPYAPWFDNAYVDFKSTGIKDMALTYEDAKNADGVKLPLTGLDMTADEEEVYYWVNNAWVNADDVAEDFVVGNPIIQEVATTNKKVELCAKLVSEYDGWSKAVPGKVWDPDYFWAGDYAIGFVGSFDDKERFNGSFMVCDMTEAEFEAFVEEHGPSFTSGAGVECDNFIVYTVEKGKVTNVNTTQCSTEFAAKVNRDFNMTACGLDTCINEDNVQANFGWKDSQESCYAWSKNAMAIVDAECVVAIPKTGDMSVLAWLF